MDLDNKNMSAFLDQVSEIIEENLQQTKYSENLKKIPLSQQECIYIVDFNKSKVIFNRGFKSLLGFDDKEISIDLITSLYHPDDAELTDRVIMATIQYCLENPVGSSNNILFISFRIRKKDGTYIKILSQSSIYTTDDKGRLTSSLIRFTDISFIDNTENVNWNFNANNLNKGDFKQQIYESYQSLFTNREIEIIIEIEKRLTNKLIAENLKISEHTVATHRKHILKKANCHNSDKLIRFCRGKGII